MHHSMPTLTDDQTSAPNAVSFLSFQAKHLQRQAQSKSLSCALPVLRRLIANGVFRDKSLPQLKRQPELIQRKHLLHLLALETGYPDWARLKTALLNQPACELPQYIAKQHNIGYPNLWFANHEEAHAYAKEHGGEVITVGDQAFIRSD